MSPSSPQSALLTDSLYDQLCRIARRRVRQSALQSWSATVLAHEAFVRIAPHLREVDLLRNRGRFLSLASRAMRSVVVDHVRRLRTAKRDPGAPLSSAVEDVVHRALGPIDVAALGDLLEQLRVLDERSCNVVEQKVFGGCEMKEIAQALGVSERTVKNDWRFARAWLHSRLAPST